MALSGQIGVHALLTQTTAAVLGGTPTMALPYSKNWDVTSGTGADQADQAVIAERVVTTGANDDLDLTGTTLQNVFGVNIAFAKVKAIIIESLSTNTTNLTVGNGSTPFLGPLGAAAHTITLTPGDVFMVWKRAAAGWAVGAGASDILRVANAAGASATYRVIIVGTTA